MFATYQDILKYLECIPQLPNMQRKVLHRAFQDIMNESLDIKGKIRRRNMQIKDLQTKIQNVITVCDVQSQKGNFDRSEYMRGLANGLVLAVAELKGSIPKMFLK